MNSTSFEAQGNYHLQEIMQEDSMEDMEVYQGSSQYTKDHKRSHLVPIISKTRNLNQMSGANSISFDTKKSNTNYTRFIDNSMPITQEGNRKDHMSGKFNDNLNHVQIEGLRAK